MFTLDQKVATEPPIRTTRYASITTPLPVRKNDKFADSNKEKEGLDMTLELTSSRNNDKYFNSEEVDRLIEEKTGGEKLLKIVLQNSITKNYL